MTPTETILASLDDIEKHDRETTKGPWYRRGPLQEDKTGTLGCLPMDLVAEQDEGDKERPIIFTGEMVRAILDGRKTQTRRILKNQNGLDDRGLRFGPKGLEDWHGRLRPCPFGNISDRLWVRETWAHVNAIGNAAKPGDHPQTLLFKATCFGAGLYKWLSPLHMPRWASRITLEIVEVRVQRIQEITEEDAEAEGCPALHQMIPGYGALASPGTSAKDHFISIWTSLHGPDAWKLNPFVWTISFKRVMT